VPAGQFTEQFRRSRRRGGSRRTRQRQPSPLRKLDVAGQLLATCLHLHLGIPAAALARLAGADPSTISQAIKHTRSLLAQAGHRVPPGPARCRTLSDLHTLAATAGITLPAARTPDSTLNLPATPQTHVN